MPSHSKRQQDFFKKVHDYQTGARKPEETSRAVKKVAHSISPKDAEDFAKSIAELKVKKAVLSVLKDCCESTLDEEFGGTEKTDVITKEFNVEGKFEEYVKRFLGQQLSEKELEAVNTFQEVKPTKIEGKQIRYETTDDFKNSTTTVIKKLREGGDFVYVAFSKTSKAETPGEQRPGAGPGGMGGGLGGGLDGPLMELEVGHDKLGGNPGDQPTPSNDMSVPTDPDFASGTPPYENVFKKKFVKKNEAQAYLNWPGKTLNEQTPTMDPLAPMPAAPGPVPPPTPGPSVGPMTTTAPMTGTPKTSDQRKKEMGIDDIQVRKSTTFKDEIKGGAILAEFLKKLDL